MNGLHFSGALFTVVTNRQLPTAALDASSKSSIYATCDNSISSWSGNQPQGAKQAICALVDAGEPFVYRPEAEVDGLYASVVKDDIEQSGILNNPGQKPVFPFGIDERIQIKAVLCDLVNQGQPIVYNPKSAQDGPTAGGNIAQGGVFNFDLKELLQRTYDKFPGAFLRNPNKK